VILFKILVDNVNQIGDNSLTQTNEDTQMNLSKLLAKPVIDCSRYTFEQRKAELIGLLKSGRYAEVTWSTAKSGLTSRTVKLWENKAFVSGTKDIVQGNAVAHKPQYVSCVDKAKEGSSYPWVNVDINTLAEVRANGKVYKFN
jgi:hypothetical protein